MSNHAALSVMHTGIDYLKTVAKLLLKRGVRESYSQFGEDIIVQSLCKDPQGFYIDVGTYHPILYSNTYALYTKGWHGLVIDPNVSLQPLYRWIRPRDTFVPVGVGHEESATYYLFSDGAYNTFNAESAARYKTLSWLRSRGSVTSRIVSLSHIVRTHHVQKIGFLNIDVEGNDLTVLESYDWSVRPKIISIESSTFNPDMPQESEIYRFLRARKYRLAGLSGVSLLWVDSGV